MLHSFGGVSSVSTVLMRKWISQHHSQRRKDILLRRKVHFLRSTKRIRVFWPQCQRLTGGPGSRQEFSFTQARKFRDWCLCKLHLWLSHEVQNKSMSWWRPKLHSSVELKAFTLSDKMWKGKWHDKGHRNTVRKTLPIPASQFPSC